MREIFRYNTAVKFLWLVQCSAHIAHYFCLFSEDISPERAQVKQARE